MQCPKCGAEIKPGSFYCEKCGEDFHIVPDFDPESSSICEETIRKISDDIWTEEETPVKIEKDNTKTKEKVIDLEKDIPNKRNSGPIKLIAIILGTVFVLVGLIAILFAFISSSLDYKLKRINSMVFAGQYEEAISKYEELLLDHPQNAEIWFAEADAYFLNNNSEKYEELLWNIVYGSKSDETQIRRAYEKLVLHRVNSGNVNSVRDILQNSGDPALVEKFGSYIAYDPYFSIIGGYYDEKQMLEINIDGEGEIYYSLDGSEPGTDSIKYEGPVELLGGNYYIKAVSINSYGVSSRLVSAEYHIKDDGPSSPEVSLASGEYNSPELIEILDWDDDSVIYYTTDGSEPDENSLIASKIMSLLPGRNIYSFIRVDGDGISSEKLTRIYRVYIKGSKDVEQARVCLYDYLTQIEKINDSYSRVTSSGVVLGVRYQAFIRDMSQAASDSENAKDYYIYSEYIKDGENQVPTGIYYAVNIYDGTVLPAEFVDDWWKVIN